MKFQVIMLFFLSLRNCNIFKVSLLPQFPFSCFSSLHDNELICDCSILWLPDWLRTHHVTHDVICSHPMNLKGLPIQLVKYALGRCSIMLCKRAWSNKFNIDNMVPPSVLQLDYDEYIVKKKRVGQLIYKKR